MPYPLEDEAVKAFGEAMHDALMGMPEKRALQESKAEPD